MTQYDEWRTHDPAAQWATDEDDCTCPRKLGAGGRRKADKDCPVHGIDPDIAYERMCDDGDGLQ